MDANLIIECRVGGIKGRSCHLLLGRICVICLEFVDVHLDGLRVIKPGINQKNGIVRKSGLYLIGARQASLNLPGRILASFR